MIKAGYKSINGDYIFTQVAKKVKEYRQKHPNGQLIDLGVGDVKFLPPSKICEQIILKSQNFVTQNGFCGYPSEEGLWELRCAISESYKKSGAKVLPEEIFITTGAKPALGDIFEICNFKKCLIEIPTYPLYEELCALHNAEVEFINRLNGGQNNLQNCNFNALFLCSPNNPTGRVIDENGLKKYITYAKKRNALVIIDGAYADFSSKYIPPFTLENSECVVEIRSYSKNLCFTGLRLGYVVIKKENPLHGAYKKYLSLRSNGVNVIMQRVGLSAYTNECVEEQKSRIKYYRENANLLKVPFLKAGFEVMGGVNAPYLFVKVNGSGDEFFESLLNEQGVAVTPGRAFKGENYIRVSCLNSNEISALGSEKIARYLKV